MKRGRLQLLAFLTVLLLAAGAVVLDQRGLGAGEVGVQSPALQDSGPPPAAPAPDSSFGGLK